MTSLVARCLRPRPSLLGIGVGGRSYAFWWGHDTLEDKERREKFVEEGRMIRWKAGDGSGEGETALEKRRDVEYLPARIKDEAQDYFAINFTRFNRSDYYSYIRQPFNAYIFDHKWWVHRKVNKNYLNVVRPQVFNKERLLAVGPDLAAAYFVAALGGKARFVGHSAWTAFDEAKGKIDLPSEYESGWHMEAIDLSTTDICYEGLHNCRNLIYLKYLDVSYCPHVDDFVVNRIVGEYADSLEVLDLSGCEDITFGSIECLWRLSKLKTLLLYDLDHIVDLRLLCVLLLEIFPDLDIRGVDYIDAELLKGTPNEGLVEEYDKALEQSLALPAGEIAKNAAAEERTVDASKRVN